MDKALQLGNGAEIFSLLHGIQGILKLLLTVDQDLRGLEGGRPKEGQKDEDQEETGSLRHAELFHGSEQRPR